MGPNGWPRQIDYILMDKLLFRMLHDSGSNESLDLGSDRLAVRTKFIVKQPAPVNKDKKHKSSKRRPQRIGWEGIDVEEYKDKLDFMLSDAKMEIDLGRKCQQIEEMMTKAAEEQARYQWGELYPKKAARASRSKATIGQYSGTRAEIFKLIHPEGNQDEP